MARSTVVSAAIVAAMVFTGSTPAVAADNAAVKRIIIVTVLKNLGVDPSAQLVDQLVGDISLDDLEVVLVKRVAKALDSSADATVLIGQTIDSDGDGIPDENAATEAAESGDDESDDSPGKSGSGTSNSGTSNGGSSNAGSGGSGGSKGEDDPEVEDEPEDDPDPEDDSKDEDEQDDHGGDN